MSKKQNKSLKNYLLNCISNNKTDFIKKAMEAFSVSRSTVYNYIKILTDEGLIQKQKTDLKSSNACGYILCFNQHIFKYELSGKRLSEDRIYNADILPLIEDLPDNVKRIWQYSVTEMLNNALEHSQAENIVCKVVKTPINTTVCIHDDGIGIFENIRKYYIETENVEYTHTECASVLLVGKFTTARECHSGEGIFFTSHLTDKFVIYSGGTYFSRTDWNDLQLENAGGMKGTYVEMSLSNESKKTTFDIFNRFSGSDCDFNKTNIPISHMFGGTDPVSRSEARRLGELLDSFEEVTLDFANVSEIGQAFAHELFCVWKKKHTDMRLNVDNAGEAVTFMIKRAINTR